MHLVAAFGVVGMFFRAIVYSMETEMKYSSPQTVTINCNLTKSYNSVSWFLGSTKIAIYSENTTKTKDSRVVVGNNGHGEYFLKLVNTTRFDEGLYRCVPDTPHMLDVHYFNLKHVGTYTTEPECNDVQVDYEMSDISSNVSIYIYFSYDNLTVKYIDQESCAVLKDREFAVYISQSRQIGNQTASLKGSKEYISIDPGDFQNSSMMCFNASNNYGTVMCKIKLYIKDKDRKETDSTYNESNFFYILAYVCCCGFCTAVMLLASAVLKHSKKGP